jgi:hypothetical protein
MEIIKYLAILQFVVLINAAVIIAAFVFGNSLGKSQKPSTTEEYPDEGGYIAIKKSNLFKAKVPEPKSQEKAS